MRFECIVIGMCNLDPFVWRGSDMRPAAVVFVALAATVALAPVQTDAAGPPCRPCVGLTSPRPADLAAALGSQPRLTEDERLYVRWSARPDDIETVAASALVIAEAGAVPWVELEFSAMVPMESDLETLTRELDAAAELARRAPASTHYQVGWSGGTPAADVEDYAFLLKRASVAITGARDGTRVLTATLPADPDVLAALFGEEIAVYVDGVVLDDPDPDALASSLAALVDLDPGKPVVITGRAREDDPWRVPVVAARDAAAGAALTLFDADPVRGGSEEELLAPLLTVAREFAGDLAFDSYSSPTGAAGGWAFVRATDLGLRVVVDRGDADDGPWVTFSDPTLRSPVLVAPDGSEIRLFGDRGSDGFRLAVSADTSSAVLRLDRPTAAELGGFAEQVDVASQITMPVEEILRRLQANEDDQRRRIRHYEATYTQHLRFRPGDGLSPIEATFTGPLFSRRDEGFDWVWRSFLINGVRWKGRIPELPLLQPAKAAEKPLEITFDRSYRYRLRGEDEVDGRRCWVVDFEPADEPEPGTSLWRGTVWIDHELYVRVRSRALQVGLAGDVLSNEETQEYAPISAEGTPLPWEDDAALVLPLRTVGQEIQSILNTPVQVEKESLLTDVRVNADGFDERLETAWASDDTMLRDTPDGLRYLEPTDEGSREVQPDFDESRWFLLAGTYYDEGLDFPLPLAGVNYFDNDFLESGNQVNLFFAGVLVNGNWADPDVFGSRWDAGARVFGFFLPREQELYRAGVESLEEAVENTTASLDLYLGRPLDAFTKLDLTYELDWNGWGRADDTAPDFVLPQDTFTHSLGGDLTYTRSGWRLAVGGSWSSRADWEFWGLPGNTEYDPAQKDYATWEASLTKTFWLGRFTKLGVQLEHLGGSNLDRFSKYDFSFFGDSSVAGYQSGLVTASRADAVHVDYGFNIGEVIRLGVRADAAWADDEATGLDRELLAGVSLNGTLIGPWQTVVTFDVGIPVEGPADGFTLSVVFLKLFD
jgi:hypothetical protein